MYGAAWRPRARWNSSCPSRACHGAASILQALELAELQLGSTLEGVRRFAQLSPKPFETCWPRRRDAHRAWGLVLFWRRHGSVGACCAPKPPCAAARARPMSPTREATLPLFVASSRSDGTPVERSETRRASNKPPASRRPGTGQGVWAACVRPRWSSANRRGSIRCVEPHCCREASPRCRRNRAPAASGELRACSVDDGGRAARSFVRRMLADRFDASVLRRRHDRAAPSTPSRTPRAGIRHGRRRHGYLLTGVDRRDGAHVCRVRCGMHRCLLHPPPARSRARRRDAVFCADLCRVASPFHAEIARAARISIAGCEDRLCARSRPLSTARVVHLPRLSALVIDARACVAACTRRRRRNPQSDLHARRALPAPGGGMRCPRLYRIAMPAARFLGSIRRKARCGLSGRAGRCGLAAPARDRSGPVGPRSFVRSTSAPAWTDGYGPCRRPRCGLSCVCERKARMSRFVEFRLLDVPGLTPPMRSRGDIAAMDLGAALVWARAEMRAPLKSGLASRKARPPPCRTPPVRPRQFTTLTLRPDRLVVDLPASPRPRLQRPPAPRRKSVRTGSLPSPCASCRPRLPVSPPAPLEPPRMRAPDPRIAGDGTGSNTAP